ncbi:sodium:solute symporter [Portibacter marinus]|uniref:sodium:solute symporter n=1 Tax=Portibacter marinus TaxID=2898660 RepID=UPI001F1D8A8E|nr:sodium:solute symporter [Portibacter marinus]
MKSFNLSTLDIIIMAIYAILIIGYGIYHSKRSSSEDYFLGGRSMTWPIIGIALFSANISSSTLVGLAGDAFKTNVHVYNYEWFAVVVLIIFAIFFLPFYLKSGVFTMPEFLEKRYDSRSRYYFSFITIVGNILVDTAAGLYVGSVVLKILFPEIPSTYIIIGLALAAAAYTIPGGLNSVIQTEVIQAILLIFGSILLTYYAFDQLGGGWSDMMDQLTNAIAAGQVEVVEKLREAGHYAPANADEVFSLVRPSNDEFMPWWGLLTGVPLLGFYFWANNQFMVQRVLGAKNLNHGRWGALFGGLLKLPVIFIMIVPGVLAILLFSELDISSLNYFITGPDGSSIPCSNLSDCPNLTYPVLLLELLPTGILGLVVAGLLAAMMSSVSATFNSASTLITMDFAIKINPKLTSKQLVRIGQIATLVLVVLASAWVPYIETVSDSLWKYLQLVISYTAPPAVSTFVLGLFWTRANGSGSIASLLFGFVFAVFMLSLQIFGGNIIDNGGSLPQWMVYLTSLHFLSMAFILFISCILVHIVVSLATAPPDDETINNLTWNTKLIKEETEELSVLPWYQNYRYLAVLLLLVTALLVGYFW